MGYDSIDACIDKSYVVLFTNCFICLEVDRAAKLFFGTQVGP